METKLLRIALAGNPNSGKTTLFNALTGAHHKVGNYPGVTVEKREGDRVREGRRYHFIDLPGIYSLTAYSIDEVVARDFILDEKPDLIVDVLDSTNLERHLYLALQMQELGIPLVGALNMSDEADAKGIRIDAAQLTATLGIPFVKIAAQKGRGLEELLDGIDARAGVAADAGARGAGEEAARRMDYGVEIEAKLATLEQMLASTNTVSGTTKVLAKANTVSGTVAAGATADGATGGAAGAVAGDAPARWLAVKLLEKDANVAGLLSGRHNAGAIREGAKEAIVWIEKHFGKDAEIVISEQRYGYIRGAVTEAVRVEAGNDFSLTESIDRVIMNRFLSLPVFLAVLWAMFQLTFSIGVYPQMALEAFFGLVSDTVNRVMSAGPLRSLIVDGIIAGVGGVFSFVPLIVILFFFLSILEDVGYMSRAAFATDKFLHSFGLHGQSIFPMMLGFGCSVPAIMASRTLKSRRDRIITVLVTPMMSCGAKLPIHVLFAAAFFPNNAANMVMLVYACGVVTSLVAASILKRTILRGDPTPFVMELPPYRLPTWQGILWHVWEKTWHYIKKAGTVILASSVLIWLITTFPSYEFSAEEAAALDASFRAENPGSNDEEFAAYLETSGADARLEHSVAGRIGHFIEPVFRPIGFGWKMAVATVTGFAAKEVVVSTLGILYRVGLEEDEESESLRDALAADPDMSPLKGFVLMLFMLLIPPCFAALATIKAELGWAWLGFEFCFLLLSGWILAFAVFQLVPLAGLLRL
jgi:ferrous iron transport protein B